MGYETYKKLLILGRYILIPIQHLRVVRCIMLKSRIILGALYLKGTIGCSNHIVTRMGFVNVNVTRMGFVNVNVSLKCCTGKCYSLILPQAFFPLVRS